MKAVVLLLLVCYCSFSTTLSGTLQNPDGSGANGYLFLSVSQQAALSASGGCGGPLQVVPTIEIRIQVVNGVLQSPPSIYGNDCLLPQGTYYNIRFIDNQGNNLYTDRWIITGVSIDVGTIVSAVITGTTATLGSVGVVLTAPTAAQTVTQPSTTLLSVNNFDVTTHAILPGGVDCKNGGCTFAAGAGFLGGLTTSPVSNSNITIGAGGNFYNRIFNGGDVACGGIGDGWMGFRTDATHESLEVCLHNNRFTIITCDQSQVCNFGSAANFFGGFTTLSTTNSTLYIGLGNFYGRVFTGEANCSGIQDGWTGFRLDTNQLEICNGGVVKHIDAT